MTMTPAEVEAAAPEWMTFLRASEWGINPQHSMAPERLNDPEGFLHHTAGSRMGTDPIAAMKRLERFSHGRGYATVAYDAVLHRNTDNQHITIMGGREGYRSAATKDRNEQGEALCVMGYFQPGHSLSEHPTDREIEGSAWGFVWMIAHGWLARKNTILGHRDNPAHPGATSCPGDWLWVHLPHIRQRVTQIIAEIEQPTIPPTPPPPTGGNDVIHPLHKYRNSDTRHYGYPLKAGVDHEFGLDPAQVPREAVAVALTVAVVGQGRDGWCDFRPAGTPFKGTSTVNFQASGAHNGATVIGVSDGKFIVRLSQPAHVIVDVTAFWT